MLCLSSDASVIIDIENSSLTAAMFGLPYEFIIPDVVFSEELEEKHNHLKNLGLTIKSMPAELMHEASILYQKHSGLSFNDALVLILAKNENCYLLTGDRLLRKIANQLHIGVRGTIWLVEQIIRNDQLTIEQAQLAFQKMKTSGSRLPWGEVENILTTLIET